MQILNSIDNLHDGSGAARGGREKRGRRGGGTMATGWGRVMVAPGFRLFMREWDANAMRFIGVREHG